MLQIANCLKQHDKVYVYSSVIGSASKMIQLSVIISHQEGSIQPNMCFGVIFCYKMQKCLFKESLITVKTMNNHDVKFIHWKCIKPFLVFLTVRKEPVSQLCFCGAICLFQLAEEHIETSIPDHNLSCSKLQSSVIVSKSKMIHLLCLFVVWKGTYGPICVLGGDVMFAQNDNNSLRSLNNSSKTTEQDTKP